MPEDGILEARQADISHDRIEIVDPVHLIAPMVAFSSVHLGAWLCSPAPMVSFS